MKYFQHIAIFLAISNVNSQADTLGSLSTSSMVESLSTQVLDKTLSPQSTELPSSENPNISTSMQSNIVNSEIPSSETISKEKVSGDNESADSSTDTNSESSSIASDDDFDDKEVVGDDNGDSDSSELIDGQPGRINMITPPSTVSNPLFELNSIVKLSWKYTNDMTIPPEKLMIVGVMPNNGQYNQPGTNLPIKWNIASNITGTKYSWNTSTQVPQGVSLGGISGYKMIFYDGDIGFVNGSSVHKGQLINFQLTFSMYRSEYANTNDGVPKNYDPNNAAKHFPEAWLYFFVSVSIRAPCCKKWYDCPACHEEASDHPLLKLGEVVMACKKCKKVFRITPEDLEDSDEYCPHCDNHFVIEAKTPKMALGVEGDDIRVDNRMAKDFRIKNAAQRTVFNSNDLDFRLG
ncbi:hypothetical protein BB561_000832 [Smittium simulii]|uniref:CHY-type domain-containing protein n=1 Tax=Smittium simulii TaxID=133385 RepID=A0A2T9YXF3_9FUNG|nr:hypothetical protein BB561_000832 [Smittium simulii]